MFSLFHDVQDKWMFTKTAAEEVSLEPANWDEFRRLAHRMVDDTIDYLASRREQPVWQPMPETVRASFQDALRSKALERN